MFTAAWEVHNQLQLLVNFELAYGIYLITRAICPFSPGADTRREVTTIRGINIDEIGLIQFKAHTTQTTSVRNLRRKRLFTIVSELFNNSKCGDFGLFRIFQALNALYSCYRHKGSNIA
ncbi:hypothetical protein [Marinobacter sp. JSM 1782161]|uniref:hypothetical protein n=1 Tax=Marinobacter sp. JSM 1782161 TaxID=2685906 RepID=UPI001403D4F2|nr:hypothetical protein [Marinobacter sp. JSM 1782161]